MNSISRLFETYFTVLVHPFRIHDQFRHGVAIPYHEGHFYQKLTLAESLSISWVFAGIRGLFKIIILNYFLHSLLSMQSESFPFLQDFVGSSGLSTYYFFLFSAALDIIFFPVVTLISTEVWAFIIRFFTQLLNPQLPAKEIADDITTHALSSNLLCMIPFLGDIIQPLIYIFLIYAGLRSNLGASRSLSWVILLTPTLLLFIFISLFLFTIFYLGVSFSS